MTTYNIILEKWHAAGKTSQPDGFHFHTVRFHDETMLILQEASLLRQENSPIETISVNENNTTSLWISDDSITKIAQSSYEPHNTGIILANGEIINKDFVIREKKNYAIIVIKNTENHLNYNNLTEIKNEYLQNIKDGYWFKGDKIFRSSNSTEHEVLTLNNRLRQNLPKKIYDIIDRIIKNNNKIEIYTTEHDILTILPKNTTKKILMINNTLISNTHRTIRKKNGDAIDWNRHFDYKAGIKKHTVTIHPLILEKTCQKDLTEDTTFRYYLEAGGDDGIIRDETRESIKGSKILLKLLENLLPSHWGDGDLYQNGHIDIVLTPDPQTSYVITENLVWSEMEY